MLSYIFPPSQGSKKIAKDIFTRSSDLVASIVVVPLLVGGTPLGGIYFALETPHSFENLQNTLLVRRVHSWSTRRYTCTLGAHYSSHAALLALLVFDANSPAQSCPACNLEKP